MATPEPPRKHNPLIESLLETTDIWKRRATSQRKRADALQKELEELKGKKPTPETEEETPAVRPVHEF